MVAPINRKLHIAIISRDLSAVSGTTLYVPALCRALRRLGHKVKMVGMEPVHQDIPVDEHFEIVADTTGRLQRAAALGIRLEEIHAKEPLDLTIGCYTHGVFASLLLYTSYDIPFFIYLCGGEYLKASQGKWKRSYFRSALNKAAGILTSGPSFPTLLQSEVGVSSLPPVRLLPVAVDEEISTASKKPHLDVRRMLNLEASAQIVMFVGRMVQLKGPDVLLTALLSLVAKQPDIHGVFIGDGPMRAELITKTRAENLEDRIHWLGHRPPDEIPSLMCSADVIVVPSVLSEPRGNSVILEAMAVGIPLIASKIGGIPELIHHGENGLLVSANDSEALAQQIINLLQNPELAQYLSKNEKKTALNSSWSKKAKMISDFIFETLGIETDKYDRNINCGSTS